MPKSKKVAILANYLSPFDGRIIKFSNAINQIGFDVDAISFVGVGGKYETLGNGVLLDWRNGAVLRLPIARILGAIRKASPSNIAAAAGKRAIMEKELKTGSYEFVIATDPETLQIAARAKKAGGYTLIYDAHEFFEEETANDDARKNWVKKIHANAANSIDQFVTVNEAIAAEYEISEPNFPKAIVIHNAVDFDPDLHDDGRLRAAAGLGKSAKILLYQGGFAKDRGLFDLVNAFNAPIGNWHLIMMGSGALENELRAIASNRVTFLPPAPQAELKYWTAGADLGAILYEPTCKNQLLCSPNKLWEYPAAGVPILASDLPYLGKVVKANGIGFSLNNLDALTKIASSDIRIAKDNCLSYAKENNWRNEAKRLVEIITNS